VLRTDAASGVAMSWGKVEEFRILEIVHRAGVTVPAPVALCSDTAVLGRPFYVMIRHPGEARARVLVRDPEIARWGPPLARRLAAELARLHHLAAPVEGLAFLPLPVAPAADRVAEYRAHLAAMAVTNPVLDLALEVLAERAPATPRRTLIHADFRLGNILIERGELTAVLDWEFAAYGDPLEDLGWFLCRYWRFGRWRLEAGGLAPKTAFVAAYEAAAAARVEPTALLYWQLMGTVRWAVIALQQAARHYAAGEPSLELALTGAVLPQLEWDVLDLIEALDGDQ
jgi:aminoglycoside phosphotransferase (APT) family kinase protein